MCAVEARRRGVADVCDLWPGTALQKNDTFVTVALKYPDKCISALNRYKLKHSFAFNLSELCVTPIVCHPECHFQGGEISMNRLVVWSMKCLENGGKCFPKAKDDVL